jgi:hypothetical protein
MTGGGGSQGRTPKKDLENRDVQVRFVSAHDYSAIGAGKRAAGCNGN